MEGKKNYTEVLIDGKVYTMGGSEDTGYLQKIASYVNHKLKELRGQAGFSKLEEDYQQLMLEINMADDYFKAQEMADTLKQQKEEIERDVYGLKHELINTQIKLEKAQNQIVELESALSKAVNLASTSASVRASQNRESNASMKSSKANADNEDWGEIMVEDLDDYDDSIAGDLIGIDEEFSNDPDSVLIDELDEIGDEIIPDEPVEDKLEESIAALAAAADMRVVEALSEIDETEMEESEIEVEEPEPEVEKIGIEEAATEEPEPETEEAEDEEAELEPEAEKAQSEDIELEFGNEELTEKLLSEEILTEKIFPEEMSEIESLEEETEELSEELLEEKAVEEKTPEEKSAEQKALEEKQKREKEELEKKKALEAAKLATEKLFQSRSMQSWGPPRNFR